MQVLTSQVFFLLSSHVKFMIISWRFSTCQFRQPLGSRYFSITEWLWYFTCRCLWESCMAVLIHSPIVVSILVSQYVWTLLLNYIVHRWMILNWISRRRTYMLYIKNYTITTTTIFSCYITSLLFWSNLVSFYYYYRKTSNRSPQLLLEQVTCSNSNRTTCSPACIRNLASVGDPAFIKTLSTCHTRVINFLYI